MKNLTYLGIGGNEIKSLPNNIFDNLSNLETLSLSYNNIQSLEDEMFTKLDNLTRIDLVNNKLEKLPSSIKNLEKLCVLNLEGNPLPEKLASNFETIEIISGVPLACIKGRIPVLIDFKLVKKESSGYIITQYGSNFIKSIEKKS